MTVELWYGSKPEHASEQNVLIELYDFLQSQPDHYVVLSNFHAGRGHEVDLLILKPNACIVAELKHVWSKIIGGKEGPWQFVRPDGAMVPFRNPYKQVRGSSFGWQEWCREHRDELERLANCKRDLKLFEPFEYVVIFPDLNPDSQLSIGDHPVQTVGLPRFRAALVIRSQPGLNFNKQELQAIPPLLQLTRWHIAPPQKNDRTIRLSKDDFKPPVVRMLVARGHEFSAPVFHLEKEVITVGRSPDSDLVIEDASVSHQHAEIRHGEGRWTVRDLGSLNGTHVSFGGDPRMERLIEGQNAIKNGSIVRFGQASFTVLLSEQGP
jgi:hypothetical protein